MTDNFEQLITALNISTVSTDLLQKITLFLKQQQQTDESLSLFVSQSFQPLFVLESWAWQSLSHDSHQWANEAYYQDLFHTLAAFNKNFIFNNDHLEIDTKVSLLFTVTMDQINSIFQQIESTADDNDPYITIASLWFNNHSYFLHDNPDCNNLSFTNYINQYIARHYLMSKEFKFYLSQLRHSHVAESVFTAKMLFYIKTCSCSLFSYLGAKAHHFPYTANEMLRYLSDDYLQIIHVHHQTVAVWNKDLLACVGHLMAVIAKCYWFYEKNGAQMNILFPTDQTACNHVEELIRIIAHKPLHAEIKAVRSNDETVFIDSILMMLMNIVQIQNINWFFRSSATIQDVMLTVAETSLYDEICLRAYTILGEVLTDEQLKELNIADTMAGFFFKMLEQAWQHPSKEYKQIPIKYLLKDFQTLSKNDSIQQTTANLNKIPLLVNVCEQYPIVYQILWTLSFNQDIQQQLRSSSSFMSQLLHLAEECDNEQMRKVIHGILWNLEIHRENHPTSDVNDGKTFDIMISYSHKDEKLCKQIYHELMKAGCCVWIDFDQLHGNVMDAMAQAIERSQTVVICMSEQYRKSNYCRAEAHYAFQRQLKIIPVLLQKHYKPDGWLLFLMGQLLYVDFTKYEFNHAMNMLLKELEAENIFKIRTRTSLSLEGSDSLFPVTSTSLTPVRSTNIIEWTQAQTQDWLTEHNLVQLCHLFADCDGRSLFYLSKYMKQGDLRQILISLQGDALRRTNQDLSFLELSRFQSLMDQYHSDDW